MENTGYDKDDVDDPVMKTLASKLGDDCCELLFRNSLPAIADSLGIPKRQSEDKPV